MTNLFFISSPLHFLIGCNIASENKQDRNIAVIISRNEDSAKGFEKAIGKGLTDFASSIVLLEKKKGVKFAHRRTLFQKIKTLVEQEQPQAIYTGNDRRTEFQYAMDVARQQNEAAEGIYMDDGAISYLGHKSLGSIFHEKVDPTLKKAVYGSWWKNPLTTGASEWISSCYLAFPDLAHPLLQSKTLKPINPDAFTSPSFSEISRCLLEDKLDSSQTLSNIKVLFCLPVDDEYEASHALFNKAFTRYASQFPADQIAIKAHPRSQLDKIIQSHFEGTVVLPKSIGIEALLPLLSEGTQIIGTASTSLLTSRWLRPDIAVYSVSDSNDEKLAHLLEALKIQRFRI